MAQTSGAQISGAQISGSKPLAGKVALVTGGSRGIGRAIALRLARDGAAIGLASRDPATVRRAVDEIEQGQGQALGLSLDLREAAAPARLVAETVAKFGRLDIVVNNAGATKRGDFLALTDEDFADGFALKYYSAVRSSRAAWPHLRQARGSVVNIIGIGGRAPGAEFAIGGSVNAALLSFTKVLAEIGVRDGVQVAAVNPGLVRTDRFAGRLTARARQDGTDAAQAEAAIVKDERITRIGEPEDIANLVGFIVSPEGSWIQGSLIDIDGGNHRSL